METSDASAFDAEPLCIRTFQVANPLLCLGPHLSDPYVMKKLILIPLLALLVAPFIKAGESDVSRTELMKRVDSCEAILEEFQDHPSEAIPPAVWARAKGIIILNQVHAGFLFGIKHGMAFFKG